MRIPFTIALHDLRVMLREKETLLWLFVMPSVFFWFLGTVQGNQTGGEEKDAIGVRMPSDAGALGERLEQLLQAEHLAVRRAASTEELAKFSRQLEVPAGFTATLERGGRAQLVYAASGQGNGLAGDYDKLRVQRAAGLLLAEVIALDARQQPLTAPSLQALAAEPRALTLDVKPAGARPVVPTGFAQAVPGTMVMFTLMILLTGGGVPLMRERQSGLLRRLASAPLTRGQVVRGKALARVLLAVLQISFGMALGTWVFGMDWGPDLLMVAGVLLAWAALCAMLGMCAGNLARSSGQAVGIGIAGTMVLAALGGCWWPIEVTPRWMQSLASCLPTGWTMGAIHQLVTFQNGPASALGSIALLLTAALVMGIVAARTFRYQE